VSGAPVPKRVCLITGASSGIGAAFADVYAAHGYDLVLTARRLDRLEAKAAELRARHGTAVHVAAADLVAADAVPVLMERLAAEGVAVDALVNNAGFGLSGSFLASDWEAQRRVIRLLLEVPAELVHALAPGMVARHFGRIVNVASVAGLVTATAGHTLYPATKAALVRFSQSLNLELSPSGVHVTALCPGFTYSEFHDANGTRDIVSKMPKWMWLTAEEVVADGYAACEANRPITVPGGQYKAITALARLLPESVGFALMKRSGDRIRKV
jgi:short-subunit dehydrogenase